VEIKIVEADVSSSFCSIETCSIRVFGRKGYRLKPVAVINIPLKTFHKHIFV